MPFSKKMVQLILFGKTIVNLILMPFFLFRLPSFISKLTPIKLNFIPSTCSLFSQDKHANTPLHLACMLGHLDLVRLLTANGARVKVRNLQMWTPLNEAISYGNRELIRVTLHKFEQEVEQIVEDAKPKVIAALKEMDDFRVEVKWDFESWLPFVSRFLPSDLCRIRKKVK